MKNYITTELLPELIHDLAEKFLEECDKVAIDISLFKNTDNCRPSLEVKVLRNETWETLTENKYDIINKPRDCYDVLDETINEALTQL